VKAYIIGDIRSETSKNAMDNCINSTDIRIERFQQVSAEDVTDDDLRSYTYPKRGEKRFDEKAGLSLTGYGAKNIKRLVACILSHLHLWNRCLELNEDVMILEHDAIFTRKFEPFEWEGGVLGLNDPRGATRRSRIFHDKASSVNGISDCPTVDGLNVPQGLAGNSAYIIKPFAAKYLLDLIDEYGIWPNDAIMCNQLCPWLKVVYPYYTRVQGIQSTTML
jgi:GR25 family glycosyltransferase involved in LPS biosynthesis